MVSPAGIFGDRAGRWTNCTECVSLLVLWKPEGRSEATRLIPLATDEPTISQKRTQQATMTLSLERVGVSDRGRRHKPLFVAAFVGLTCFISGRDDGHVQSKQVKPKEAATNCFSGHYYYSASIAGIFLRNTAQSLMPSYLQLEVTFIKLPFSNISIASALFAALLVGTVRPFVLLNGGILTSLSCSHPSVFSSSRRTQRHPNLSKSLAPKGIHPVHGPKPLQVARTLRHVHVATKINNACRVVVALCRSLVTISRASDSGNDGFSKQGALNTPTRQFPRSQSSLHLPTTMVRALFVVATLALSCSAVLAHEGHDHGSMAAGSTAGSHAGSGEDHHNHDAGETGSAHGSATGSSGVSGTAAVPTPAPSSATTVFSIALPLTAAAVATLAATN